MEVICFTTSAGECRSMSRLWILQNHTLSIMSTRALHFYAEQITKWASHSPSRGETHLISKRSQVLVPSPQGDFLVVMCRTLVGMRTGPLTFSCLSLAPVIKSEHTAVTQSNQPSCP